MTPYIVLPAAIVLSIILAEWIQRVPPSDEPACIYGPGGEYERPWPEKIDTEA